MRVCVHLSPEQPPCAERPQCVEPSLSAPLSAPLCAPPAAAQPPKPQPASIGPLDVSDAPCVDVGPPCTAAANAAKRIDSEWPSAAQPSFSCQMGLEPPPALEHRAAKPPAPAPALGAAGHAARHMCVTPLSTAKLRDSLSDADAPPPPDA